MEPMYLSDVETHRGVGPRAEAIEQMRAAGIPVPQRMHLLAFKPDRTDHLAAFTQGVMRGPSPLLAGQRELIAAKKMVHDSLSIGEGDVGVVRDAGWSDEALYDAITVVALFQFYNAWIDATGVRDMSALGYEMSGRRLATTGYVMGKQ